MSDDLNSEKQAVVQRSVNCPESRRWHGRMALPLFLLLVIGLPLTQELDPFVVLLYRHGVDPEERGRTGHRKGVQGKEGAGEKQKCVIFWIFLGSLSV